ncbi:hypothetical protein, conserved [Trypanosoma brucei gambiense DAL972]|uniref:Uncharacterized protein n=1 Tax=Trypanosoma brucei gambiense (strain MHOM/CI/86/DAL972) TaxID=679716 RepID=D0A136_TRYB9|nr:hypothetical protein, conserved [Trypanosoma brucei gambiense DAL972]CBH14978.1 hypothetical protein, conserved [Trypanosoma brucei gambiense DAL972]|eukprot:XP_011777244.1 hypothetical protein, conserved [Trypanosoma brucei gambiense DAL972]
MVVNTRVSPNARARPPPRRPVNQHHLPPLQPTTSLQPLHSPHVRKTSEPAYRRGSTRNCCSVSATPVGADVVHYHAGNVEKDDPVSYAAKHQLPLLLNSMIRDLLRERPEVDVDGWIMRWFEREYEEQKRVNKQRLEASTVVNTAEPTKPEPQQGHRQPSLPLNEKWISQPFVTTVQKDVQPTTIISTTPSNMSSPTVVISLPQRRLSTEVMRTSTPSSLDSRSCTIVMHPPEDRKANLLQLETSHPTFTKFPSISSVSVAPTIIVPRSLPQQQERRPQRIGEEKEQQQMIVIRMPRPVDCRTKMRTTQYLDINGNDGAAPKAT